MVEIQLSTTIAAPIERCFDLSLSIDLELASTKGRQRAIGGVTLGLIGPGQEVTWSGRHFGLLVRHTSRITAYEFPYHFQDSMVRGIFHSYSHDHHFETCGDGTVMKDIVRFAAPFGVLGLVVERVLFERHMRGLLERRNLTIKHAAESDEYRKYLSC